MIVAFVDDHRDEFGVEPVCRLLQVAPSTYYAAKKREVAPSRHAARDAVLMQVLMQVLMVPPVPSGAPWPSTRRWAAVPDV